MIKMQADKIKIWEAWGDPKIGACSFSPAPITDKDKIIWERNLKISIEFAAEYGDEFVHLYSIIAPDYIQAMTEYYKAQGWGEYKPDAWTLEQLELMKQEELERVADETAKNT
jgi:hypothetical protein